MMMLGCMIGVMAMDTVVRRSDEASDEASLGLPKWLTMQYGRDFNDGVCKDGGMSGLPVFIRWTTSAEPIEGNPANPAIHAIPADKHTFPIGHRFTADMIHKMMKRYKKKARSLLKAIEHVASKTSMKGGKNAKWWTGNPGSHFESHGIQEVIGRMRGFEKCRGLYDHLLAENVEDTREAQANATEFRNLLTDGDDCCDEECYATENGGRKWNADKEEVECVPCKSGAPLKLNGEPEYAIHPQYEPEHPLHPLSGKLTKEVKGRVSIDDPKNSEQYRGSKECYRMGPVYSGPRDGIGGHWKCEGPDGQCLGLKSLARRAAKELSITLTYDACQTMDPKTPRSSPARLCGPFAPGGCQLSLEHILMRGNAEEVWMGEYGEAKAFGATCTKGSGEKKLYERFGEPADGGAIPLLQWADKHMHDSPNDNGDEKDKDIKY